MLLPLNSCGCLGVPGPPLLGPPLPTGPPSRCLDGGLWPLTCCSAGMETLGAALMWPSSTLDAPRGTTDVGTPDIDLLSGADVTLGGGLVAIAVLFC